MKLFPESRDMRKSAILAEVEGHCSSEKLGVAVSTFKSDVSICHISLEMAASLVQRPGGSRYFVTWKI